MTYETVTVRGQIYELLPGELWHLATPSSLLLNNAYLSKGIISSISDINRIPGLENAVSPYALKAMNDAKEAAWEKTRLSIGVYLPSRLGAFYLFDNDIVAQTVAPTWFSNETERHLLEVRVVRGARILRGDARLLDCDQTAWETASRRYWNGEMTADPLPEILVDGMLYFPYWDRPPFGIGAGFKSANQINPRSPNPKLQSG